MLVSSCVRGVYMQMSFCSQVGCNFRILALITWTMQKNTKYQVFVLVITRPKIAYENSKNIPSTLKSCITRPHLMNFLVRTCLRYIKLRTTSQLPRIFMSGDILKYSGLYRSTSFFSSPCIVYGFFVVATSRAARFYALDAGGREQSMEN